MKQTGFSLIFAIAFLVVLPLAFSEPVDCFKYYNFQNGVVFSDFHTEKFAYSPGDTVVTSYKLYNADTSPIVEGRVRAQVFYVDGQQGELMLDEFYVSEGLNLFNKDGVQQEIRWKIPEGAKDGDYIVKTYFIVGDYFNLAGISFLPYGPPGVPAEQTNFKVRSSSSSRIYLSKEDTYFNDEKYGFGMFAPIIRLPKPVSIKTSLVNEGASKSAEVLMETYEWDDTDKGPIAGLTVSKTVTLGANSRQDLNYSLPILGTGAYLTKITAKSGSEKTITKIRFAVAGEKARLAYMGIDKFPLKAGEKTNVFMCFSNSADYESFFEGKAVIRIYDDKGTVIYEKTQSPLSITPDPDIGEVFEMTPATDTRKLTMTAEIYGPNGSLMDSSELIYDYSRFASVKANMGLEIRKHEFNRGEPLPYKITYLSADGKVLEGKVVFYIMDSDGKIVSNIFERRVPGSLEGTLTLPERAGPYRMALRDYTHGLTAEKSFTVLSGPLDIPGAKTPGASGNILGNNLLLILLALIALAVIMAVVFKSKWKKE